MNSNVERQPSFTRTQCSRNVSFSTISAIRKSVLRELSGVEIFLLVSWRSFGLEVLRELSGVEIYFQVIYLHQGFCFTRTQWSRNFFSIDKLILKQSCVLRELSGVEIKAIASCSPSQTGFTRTQWSRNSETSSSETTSETACFTRTKWSRNHPKAHMSYPMLILFYQN